MLKLAADENLNNNIIRGLRRKSPDIDIIRVQDVGLSGAQDPVVLEWAAHEGRVLLTHDVQTITRYAYERIERALPMPGVFEVSQTAALGLVIEDIILLAESSFVDEWEGRIGFIPLP